MFQPLLNQLQNADPAQRRQAVMALGTIRHPRARQALRYVYYNDPDGSVRDAALQYLPGIRNKLGLPPVGNYPNVNGGPAHSTAPNPRQVFWDCVYCGTRDITGAACPNCAAPRPTEADEKAAAAANTPVNTPLDQLFQAGPPQRGQAWNNQQNAGDYHPIMSSRGAQRRRQQRDANAIAANAAAFLFLLMLAALFILWLTRGYLLTHHVLIR